jgi:hypothetical protein
MEETIFKIFFALVVTVAICIIIAVFLIIIKVLFLFFPEVNIMGIHMTPIID